MNELVKIMKNRMIYTKIDNTCGKIVKGIRDSSSSLGLEINVNSLGSMFQIFFSSNLVRDYTSAKKSDVKLYKKFFDQLLKEGIFVPPSQYETCFISYSHSKIDIMNTVESFDNALQKVRS